MKPATHAILIVGISCLMVIVAVIGVAYFAHNYKSPAKPVEAKPEKFELRACHMRLMHCEEKDCMILLMCNKPQEVEKPAETEEEEKKPS